MKHFSIALLRNFILSSLLIMSGSYSAHAQNKEPYIYGELGVCGASGRYNCYGTMLNAVFSKNNIITLSFYSATREAQNLPSGFTQNVPQQTLNLWGLSYGKVLFLRNAPCLRFILKGGISLGTATSPANITEYHLLFVSDYTYSYVQNFVIGLVLDPAIEFPTGRWFGFSLGPYININDVSSVYGVKVSAMIGKIRSTKHGYVSY